MKNKLCFILLCVLIPLVGCSLLKNNQSPVDIKEPPKYQQSNPLNSNASKIVYGPSELTASLVDAIINVDGIASLGEDVVGLPITCTEQYCPKERPDCNQCVGPLVLTDIKNTNKFIVLTGTYGQHFANGQYWPTSIGCEKGGGIWKCNPPIDLGKEYLVIGKLGQNNNYFWLEVQEFKSKND